MGKFEDLTGKKFGMLTVMYRSVDYIQPSGQHKRVWHCKCECGNECDIRANDLKSGNTKSCGCLQQTLRGQTQFQDLTGQVFGKYTVMYRMPDHVTPSGQKQRMWHCKCECGNERNIYASQLKRGIIICECERKKDESLLGQQFGSLTVVEFDKSVNGKDYWLCNCQCGKKNISVVSTRLKSGRKTSCGCLNLL